MSIITRRSWLRTLTLVGAASGATLAAGCFGRNRVRRRTRRRGDRENDDLRDEIDDLRRENDDLRRQLKDAKKRC